MSPESLRQDGIQVIAERRNPQWTLESILRGNSGSPWIRAAPESATVSWPTRDQSGSGFTMWATCCNWFCQDGHSEETQQAQGARTQAYSNPGYSSFPSPTSSEPSCKNCGTHFGSTTRKHTCLDCKKDFCISCSSQVGNGARLCYLCQRFRATAFHREELMKMKVKDLRDYLSLHDISSEMCREKEELVFLVLGQQPVITQEDRTCNTPFPSGLPEHQAFLAQPHTSTAPPTSPNLPPSPAQPTCTPSAQAQENQQANGHVPQDQEEVTCVENVASAPVEDETQSIDSEDNLVPGRRASLSDLVNVEDIEALTVRQLKEILARNFVNYKGCCEKWELMERVTRLYREQKDLQHLGEPAPSSAEENLCKICMDSPIDCVLLECGHMVTCTKCGKRMNECPICRQYVIRAVHVFRS
ncbi:E3 ubiquitin-protein ligase rififylin isoform X2 [Antechinus flavipes]|nr:E3 ubiquitin-protein ligase rififylin isoform X2 [Sarcophilus harrisii]XP_051848382.1 E3 ubiquitin-protein ligase rififylin isoform X2 [Antechinus flavipes]